MKHLLLLWTKGRKTEREGKRGRKQEEGHAQMKLEGRQKRKNTMKLFMVHDRREENRACEGKKILRGKEGKDNATF